MKMRIGFGLILLVLVMLAGLLVANPATADPLVTKVRSLRVTVMAAIDGPLTVDGAAAFGGSVDVDGDLAVGGVAFTGPIKYGVATGTIANGTTIAHGVGTTPTMALVTSGAAITTPVSLSALGPVSITLSIPDGVTTTVLYWMAGK